MAGFKAMYKRAFDNAWACVMPKTDADFKAANAITASMDCISFRPESKRLVIRGPDSCSNPFGPLYNVNYCEVDAYNSPQHIGGAIIDKDITFHNPMSTAVSINAMRTILDCLKNPNITKELRGPYGRGMSDALVLMFASRMLWIALRFHKDLTCVDVDFALHPIRTIKHRAFWALNRPAWKLHCA